MAMPWSRGKNIATEYRSGVRDTKKLTALFDACFRIQREASEAAGHHIPMVVENVRGAQEWVGKADWHYGAYFLWGDVPALMPKGVASKQPGHWFKDSGTASGSAKFGSKSQARKQWSAEVAKIPAVLSQHIARVYKPIQEAEVA